MGFFNILHWQKCPKTSKKTGFFDYIPLRTLKYEALIRFRETPVVKPSTLKLWEAKCSRLVLYVLCWSRVHLSRFHLTATPLSWQPPRSGGNELPPSLPTDKKSFSDFFFFLYKKSSGEKKSQFSKICEKLILSEKNPTSSFKIGGIFRKKIFRKFFETSVINSFFKDTSLYFGKKFQKLF